MLSLKINKEDLVKGVGQTSNIAEKRSSMPILSNILLEAENGTISLTATDMEITFKDTYPATIITPGQLTVPAKKFNEVVRLLNSEEIELTESENFTLNLSSAQFKTQMFGLSPTDFPKLPEITNVQFVKIEGVTLSNAINKTLYSVAMEETRYNLSGIYLEKIEIDSKLVLRFVSTDGYRLNIANLESENLANLEIVEGILVSRKGLAELKKMADTFEHLELGLNNNNLIAKTENSLLLMRLLEGRFPDYNLVLPKENDKILTINRKEFLEALKRISIMSSDDYKVVKFNLKENNLIISSVNPELGKAEESLNINYSAEEMEIGFNPRFFIEALSTLSSEQIKLSFSDAAKPCLLIAEEDPGYTGVILSMKI